MMTAHASIADERSFDQLVDFDAATTLLRAFANPHRFKILCLLRQGELTVGELEMAIGIRQPSMSQQLARLREDGIVSCRRDGKSMIYSIASPRAQRLVDALICIHEAA